MKFKDVLKVLDVELQANNVPYVEGHAGIGKTELAKALVKMYKERGVNAHLVSLFGSLLKEGELGGMPVTREEDGMLVNDYTLYNKIYQANKLAKQDPNGIVILFIDELN